MQVDGYSLDAQKEKLKRYAEFQNMEIVNEYSDEGKSGKSVEGRPEFQRMLDNIENGTDEVQFVLVFKLSRFGRNAGVATIRFHARPRRTSPNAPRSTRSPESAGSVFSC